MQVGRKIAALVLLLSVAGAVIAYQRYSTPSIPPGWYLNQVEDGYILITREHRLPDDSHTETYALGEQIIIETLPLGETVEAWIARQFPHDDPMIHSQGWTSVGTHRVFEVRREAGGADGQELSYHYFTNDAVMVFSLYPLMISNTEAGRPIENKQGIQALQDILVRYID